MSVGVQRSLQVDDAGQCGDPCALVAGMSTCGSID